MTSSNWKKLLKQLKTKPEKYRRFLKHNKPRERKFGVAAQKCSRCERYGAHISSYGLHLCRQCFREIAKEIGFKKFS